MKALKALLLLAAVVAPPAMAAEQLRFVTCPIYRDADAGRKSGCWLADARETATRYDVSLAPSKPDWNHPVLVEGVVAAGAAGSPCGGVVLDPVRTSILPGDCTRHMLEAEGFSGRRFTLPLRNVAPASVVRAPPAGPYGQRTFRLFFDFDQTFLIYQYDDYLLDLAITWLRAAHPRAIRIVGWAATDPVQINGTELAERSDTARERAEKIAEALVRLGIDRAALHVEWHGRADPVDDAAADGLIEPSRRRVDIIAMP